VDLETAGPFEREKTRILNQRRFKSTSGALRIGSLDDTWAPLV
jgi:hypothetical protein